MTRKEDFIEAAAQYQTAVAALEKIRDIFNDYSVFDLVAMRTYDLAQSYSYALSYSGNRALIEAQNENTA